MKNIKRKIGYITNLILLKEPEIKTVYPEVIQ